VYLCGIPIYCGDPATTAGIEHIVYNIILLNFTVSDRQSSSSFKIFTHFVFQIDFLLNIIIYNNNRRNFSRYDHISFIVLV